MTDEEWDEVERGERPFPGSLAAELEAFHKKLADLKAAIMATPGGHLLETFANKLGRTFQRDEAE